MEEGKGGCLRRLIGLVNDIASISDYRYTVRKQYCNLARRLKLLIPMFEEMRDTKQPVSEDAVKALVSLQEALESAKELLRQGTEGSKIYLALEKEQVLNRFYEVTGRVEQALNELSFDEIGISDEVKEQVELVLSQFKRAKGRGDTPDIELYNTLHSLYNNSQEIATDPSVLKGLAEILQLVDIADLTQESIALHEMVSASDGDPGGRFEKMSSLLKKIKDFVLTENPEIDMLSKEQSLSLSSGQIAASEQDISIIMPDDFRCPISLELMKDPVIISTGQTYERSFIEKWLESGQLTCPKTKQVLTSNVLTPNYVLRSLIAQWCEAKGIEPPRRNTSSQSGKSTLSVEGSKYEALLHKLTSSNIEDQRSAACEIRLLAKRNADNRVEIAEAGAVPLLVGLLSTSDSLTQEHVVTALLNLSICDHNKRSIMSCRAVPGIVHVLKRGSMEARENAAATLFSLSVVDEYKITIGSSGAIAPLVTLLGEGTQRGKKDAATALFNLCFYQGNKVKAVRAGVVPILMQLLTEPGMGMVDEALAIFAILASSSEGKAAIGAAEAVPVLVDFIGTGSPRNRENAAAVLVHLCSGDKRHLVEAKELGVIDLLIDLSKNGTDRGKRKATQLLEQISRFVEQQKEAEAEAQSQSQSILLLPPPSATGNVDC